MTAKPIRDLELDYPLIQFLVKEVKQWLNKAAVWFTDSPSLIGCHPLHSTFVEGENLTLQCTVTAANPEPNITWYRAAANDTPLSYGFNLTFINISRFHMGKYYCVVSNGVGNKAISSTATVNVLRKFWIHGKLWISVTAHQYLSILAEQSCIHTDLMLHCYRAIFTV